MEHHQTWGDTAQRYERIRQLSQKLWSNLCQIPGVTCLRTAQPEAGLVSFTIAGHHHGSFATQLATQNMMVRLIVNPNCVRACVHYLTLTSEVDELSNVISTLIKKRITV